MATEFATIDTLSRFLTNIKNNFARLVHTHTKDQVGLSNVENKSGATIRSEMTQTEVTNALTYTPVPTTSIVDPTVATETGFAADAKLTGDAISELNKKLEQHNSGKFILSNGLHIEWGTVEVSSYNQVQATYNYEGDLSVSFSTAYTNTPIVITNINQNPCFWNSNAIYINTTGFVFECACSEESSTIGSWISIGY